MVSLRLLAQLVKPLTILVVLASGSASTPAHPRSGPSIISGVLAVGSGVELAYLDSGAPPMSTSPYTTIFAIHGLAYYSPVFTKVLDLAPNANLRFVAITRRDYNGSTPYTEDDLRVLSNGTDAERAAFLQARGAEFATFVDTFIQQSDLPAATTDGKSGGVALLGWSLGNTFSLATVANILTYPESIQDRLASYLRAIILQEPPSITIGKPQPPQAYDPGIPAALQQPAFVQWITAYFQHGDLSTRDPSVLSYVLPDISRIPSVFNMTAAQLANMTNTAAAGGSDATLLILSGPQLLASYEAALFNTTVRGALPLLTATEFTGDVTAEFGIVAYWQIQDDDAAAGGGFVNFKLVPGVNHFIHWDDPDTAIATYLASLE